MDFHKSKLKGHCKVPGRIGPYLVKFIARSNSCQSSAGQIVE